MESRLVAIKSGWAAVDKDWAVFGKTKEEALRNFHHTQTRHAEIALRKESKSHTKPLLVQS